MNGFTKLYFRILPGSLQFGKAELLAKSSVLEMFCVWMYMVSLTLVGQHDSQSEDLGVLERRIGEEEGRAL